VVSRLASAFLVMLTCGFFLFHFVSRLNKAPEFVDRIPPAASGEDKIAHNEFLLLMDVKDEHRLAEVLGEFNLKIIEPLGEWVHVVRESSSTREEPILLSSAKAKEDKEFALKIEAHDAVHSVQLNYLQNSEAVLGCADEKNNGNDDKVVKPRDPYFPYQWHLSKDQGIDLPGAWSITTGNDRTVLAIVDRGFDFLEEDLAYDRCETRKYYYENILDYLPKPTANDSVQSKHGSQVLSVLAPCTDNALGLAGIDWHAQIFAVDSKENASFSARMFGILWAAGIDVCTKSIADCPEGSHFEKNLHPANIINASFGFAGQNLLDPPYGPVLDVIGHINRQGRMVVASAGNEEQMSDRRLPGSAGGVISVGSSNQNRQSSNFSNFGRTVDVLAPGENIMGLKKGRPIALNGTSFSAPIVAGVASLMLSVNPLLSWKHVEYILKKTARSIGCDDYCPATMHKNAQAHCKKYCCDGEKNLCALGIVNAADAVRMAKAGFPETALVDVDDYYLALSDDTDLTTKILIKNWGKKAGIARLRKTNRHVILWPENVRIPPIDKDGLPGIAEATVFYDALPKKNVIQSLIIEIANADAPTKSVDQIEAILAINPDPVQPQKILKELPPKR
jgi:hypothetical protein